MNRSLAELYDAYPGHPMRKFFRDSDRWLRIAAEIAAGLGLDGPPFGLRILDIGCGVGQFVRVCKDLGHCANGLDLPDPIIAEAARCYGVQYRPFIIVPGKPLPADLDMFDLITMFGVNLRRADGAFYWVWREWESFGLDVVSRLAPGGRWVLRPNLEPGPDIVLDAERWGEVLPYVSVESNGRQITITRRLPC